MRGLLFAARALNLRHVVRHPSRTGLTVAGIAAGVALVFSISLINATLLSTFRSSVRDIAGSAELEVAATDQQGFPESRVELVEATDGVERAVPALRAITALTGPSARERRTLVLGITPAFATLFPSDTGRGPALGIDGGFGTAGRGILLAEDVARDLRVAVGDLVLAETPTGRLPVEVSGVLRGDALALLNGGRLGVMLLPRAQDLFARPGRVDSVFVVVDPRADVEDVARDLRAALGGAVAVGPPGYRAAGFERVFGSIGTLISLAGTVALFVALFVVYNTMSMALAERRKEISMAISFGATRRQIFAGYLAEAALLGAVASGVGLAAGYGLASVLVERALEAYRFLPVGGAGEVVATPGRVALAAAGGLGVAVLGAYIPARRVYLVSPIESLRPQGAYEWGTGPTGASPLRSIVSATALVAVAAVLFALYVLGSGGRWLVTVAIVAGLSGITLLLPRIVPGVVVVGRSALGRVFGTTGRLAGDSLRRNPGRTTYTVAALVLTLGVAVGVGGALRSYELQIRSLVESLAGAPLYVTARSHAAITSDQPLSGALRPRLEEVPGVRFVYPIRYALLIADGEPILTYAAPLSDALREGAATDLATFDASRSDLIAGLERGEVAISHLTASRRGLEVGDELVLPTPAGRRGFRVVSLFDDLLTFDSIYMEHDVYLRFWKDATVDEFGILVEPGTRVGAVQAGLAGAVERSGQSALVLTKDQMIGRLLEIVGATFTLGRGVQLAALIVALLTIANTLFTTVLERRWELGLQRALGMTRKQTARGIVLEAGTLGAIGGVGGAVLGLVLGLVMTQAMEAQYDWAISFRVPWALIGASVGLGVAVAALAGIAPSRAAVRGPIVSALRYE